MSQEVRVNQFLMGLLSFNVRGLGSAVKRREVAELVRTEKVDFLCL